MADGNVIKQFIDSVKEPEFESNKANLAVVSRVDSEGIVWVHLAGAQKETPTASTSSEVKSGDIVSVEWRNNKLYIGGNYSDPSVGFQIVRPSVNYVSALLGKDITVNSIHAATGYIGVLTADHITAGDISASSGYIKELKADNITAGDIAADHAAIGGLEATYAKIDDLEAARGRIDDLEANEVVVNDTLKATNANVEYLKSDWISTDRLVLTGNNKNNYPPVEITEAEFNVNKTAYWTKDGNTYTQCTSASVYDPDTQYYVRQTVKSIIEAINTANNTDPQVVVSNDKLIAASMDVAELSAITANMGTLEAGKIQKGNNFINLNTVPASMEFKNGASWAAATQGIQFDTQGNLRVKGNIEITSSNTIPTKTELENAVNNIEGLNVHMKVSGTNLVFTAILIQGGNDITSAIPDVDFEWFYRTPTGDVPMNKNGSAITIPQTSQEYGRTVVCVWTRNQDTYLLTNAGNKLMANTGAYLVGRSEY